MPVPPGPRAREFISPIRVTLITNERTRAAALSWLRTRGFFARFRRLPFVPDGKCGGNAGPAFRGGLKNSPDWRCTSVGRPAYAVAIFGLIAVPTGEWLPWEYGSGCRVERIAPWQSIICVILKLCRYMFYRMFKKYVENSKYCQYTLQVMALNNWMKKRLFYKARNKFYYKCMNSPLQ